MKTVTDTDRKRQVITDLLDEVTIHENQFGKATPSKLLSAKFAKRVMRFQTDGYRGLIRELESTGIIKTFRIESGAVFVSLISKNLIGPNSIQNSHQKLEFQKPIGFVRHRQNQPVWTEISQVPTQFFFTSKPELQWGTGVYTVASDGKLSLLESDYDSSD